MRNKESETYKAVKAIKLAKNRKASDVFSCFSHPLPPSMGVIKKPKDKSAEPTIYEATLIDFRKRWTPQEAAKLGKAGRRAVKNQFKNQSEYQKFCRYCGDSKRLEKKTAKASRRREKRRNPKPRKRPLQKKNGYQAYDDYIKSDQWEKRKNSYYQAHSRRCAACGTAKHIHLHHMHYSKLGNEPDEHLIPLCNVHHEAYHLQYGTQRDMIRTTREFITRIAESSSLLQTA